MMRERGGGARLLRLALALLCVLAGAADAALPTGRGPFAQALFQSCPG